MMMKPSNKWMMRNACKILYSLCVCCARMRYFRVWPFTSLPPMYTVDTEAHTTDIHTVYRMMHTQPKFRMTSIVGRHFSSVESAKIASQHQPQCSAWFWATKRGIRYDDAQGGPCKCHRWSRLIDADGFITHLNCMVSASCSRKRHFQEI